MPSIQGSSRILNISGSTSITGPAGIIGPTGPTGATGATGSTGPSATGIGIISATGASGGIGGSYGDNWITFYLTDGTTVGVSGARGDTGASSSETFQIQNAIEGPEYGQIFQTKNGLTAYFKSLTVSGRDISIGATSDYTILLDGITYERGRLGNTGELVYNFSGASANGALNTYWSGNQLTSRILTFRESKFSNTLSSTPVNTSIIAGTADVDGTSVMFEYITDVRGMTATNSGIHLGKTGDDDVIHRFPESLHGVPYDVGSRIGSCCFCENTNLSWSDAYSSHPNCVDYVPENYCTEIGGVFAFETCLYRPEGPDCYIEGACCVNGICVHTSRAKCEDTYGGFFASNLTCDDVQELGDSTDDDFDNGCPLPCFERGACCINDLCYSYSEYECSYFPNSYWKDAPCSEVNCCLEAITGACCLDELCYETNARTCSGLTASDGVSKGIFWGSGSSCAGPYRNTGIYSPHDCGTNIDGTIIGPIDAEGKCADGSNPPCFGCLGWSQIISSDPIDNICAADSIGYCGDDYVENPNPTIESPQCCACLCGTCSTNVNDCMGACCAERMNGSWSCSILNNEDCNTLNSNPEYQNVCWGGCNSTCELPDGTPRCVTSIGCCKALTDIMLVVDTSDSMNDLVDGSNTTKLDFAKTAMQTLLSVSDTDRDRLGLASYDFNGYLDQQLTSNYNQMEQAITTLYRPGLVDSTMSAGLSVAKLEITENARIGSAQPIVILLADGETIIGDEEQTIAEAEELKSSGVLIIGIKFGDFDSSLLQTVVSGEEYYYEVSESINSGEDLITAYLQIYSSICESSEYQRDGGPTQSCGSILLADGTCWECCCHSDIDIIG